MSPEKARPFPGFQANPTSISLPEAFFTELLPMLESKAEIQLILYLFWHLAKDESKVHTIRLMDLQADPALLEMVGGGDKLQPALQNLVRLGAVLQADLPWMEETTYFINTPQGQAAVQAIAADTWQETGQARQATQMAPEKPNIFKLYEENIGPLTPMVAETLKADETEYPADWIEEAIRQAVTRNIHNWKYVQAILSRWKKEGRGNEQNRRDDTQNAEGYRESWLGHD